MDRSMRLDVNAATGVGVELRAVIAYEDSAERDILKAMGFQYMDREWWLRSDDDGLVAAIRTLAERGYRLRAGAGFHRVMVPLSGQVALGAVAFRAMPDPRELALLRLIPDVSMVRPVSGVDPATRWPWTRDEAVTLAELEREAAPTPRSASTLFEDSTPPFRRRRSI